MSAISRPGRASPAKPAPPLSVSGLLAALRRPTRQDLLFSAKAAAAALLSLVIGFSQGLENPYWSVVTVYVVVSQPQTGAIRSKAIFRLCGTLLGGLAAAVLAFLFGAHVGVLLAATVVVALLACYAKALDRTPANYTWTTLAITLVVIVVGVAQTPDQIFDVATARMAETAVGILMIGVVDSLVAPQAATPAFVAAMAAWRGRAADWAVAGLAADTPQTTEAHQARRASFRGLAALLGALDAAGDQLPYDTAAVPPRGRDLRFLRLTIAHLMTRLAAANVWLEALRATPDGGQGAERQLAAVRDWLGERPALGDKATLDHVARGALLGARLATPDPSPASAPGREDLVRQTTLQHLAELVDQWGRLECVLHAIATGGTLPRPLAREARRAAPTRSTDYLLGVLDILPMAVALCATVAIWYATAWSGGATAVLIAFITLVFILGTPGEVRSAQGITVWIVLGYAITYLYQFVILPRITTFPTLALVLAALLGPLGVLMSMSLVGMLIIANLFTFLALQNVYAADFGSALEGLLGSVAGCLIGVAAIHVCQFDRPRFLARRLADALRRDLVDTARAGRTPDVDRLVSLSVDRMALFFGAAGALPAGDALQGEDPVDSLRLAINLLRLRRQERALSPQARPWVGRLRRAFADGYAGSSPPDRSALLALTDRALDGVWADPASAGRLEALAALTGLRVSLATATATAQAPQGEAR